jgi:hypothetical protein
MKARLIVLTFAISSVLGLVGCYVEHPHEYARGPAVYTSYSYVYYPDAEVYFEPHRQVYYWSDGGSWRSGARVPQNIVLRSHVTVNLDSSEPYKHHDEVRAKYPRQKQEEEHEQKHPDRDHQ